MADNPQERLIALASLIAGKARTSGGRAYIVGGWCRDRLLGHASSDIDMEWFGSRTLSCPDPLCPYSNLFSFIIKGFGVRAPVFRPATQSILPFEKRIIFCQVFNALGDHYYREDSVGSLLRPPGKR